jgi:hypothetical protein
MSQPSNGASGVNWSDLARAYLGRLDPEPESPLMEPEVLDRAKAFALMALWAELRRLADATVPLEPLGRILASNTVQTARLNDQLAKVGPMLESLDQLPDVSKALLALPMIAGSLSTMEKVVKDVVGEKVMVQLKTEGGLRYRRVKGKRPAGPTPPEPPAAA